MNHKNNQGNMFPQDGGAKPHDEPSVTQAPGLNITNADLNDAIRSQQATAQQAFKQLAEDREIKGTEQVIYRGNEAHNKIDETSDDVDGIIEQWNLLYDEKTAFVYNKIRNANRDADYATYLAEEQAERVKLNSRSVRKQVAAENRAAAKIAHEEAKSKRSEALDIAIESRRGSLPPTAPKPSFFGSIKNSLANAANYIWEGRTIKERDAGIVAEFGVKTLLRNTVKLFNPLPEPMKVADAPKSKSFGRRAMSFAAVLAAAAALFTSDNNGNTPVSSSSSLTSAKEDKAKDVVAPAVVEATAVAPVTSEAPKTDDESEEALPDAPANIAPVKARNAHTPVVKTEGKAKIAVPGKTADSVKTEPKLAEGDQIVEINRAAEMTGKFRMALKDLETHLEELALSQIPGPIAVNCTPDEQHMTPNRPLTDVSTAKLAVQAARGKILVARTRIATARTNSQFEMAGKMVLESGDAVQKVVTERNEAFAMIHQATGDMNAWFASGKFAAAQKKAGVNADVEVGTAKVNLAEVQQFVRSLSQDPYQVLVPGRKFTLKQPTPVKAGQAYVVVDQNTLSYTLNSPDAQRYHSETVKINKLADDVAMNVYTSRPTVNGNRVDVRNACIEALK